MNIMSVATTVVFALIIIGAVLGFFRGWKRSLTRTIILLISFILALLIAPAISTSFISKHVDGSVITFFSKNIDIEEVLNNLSKDIQLGELIKSGTITNEVIISLVNIVVNLVLFIGLFFVIQLFSLVVYWIVCIIIKIKTRDDDKEFVEKDGKYWGLKLLSVFIGIFGSCSIAFVLLMPVFGIMNICDGFIAQSEISSESASAISSSSYVCGGLYYTEDETIGEIETYIQKYADIKDEYDATFLGKFMNKTKLSNAGFGAFKRLTTVKNGSLKFDLSHEVVHLGKAYNKFKEVFVKETFYFSDNSDIDELVELYDYAVESEVLKGYIVEFLPQISDKWSNDEKFLGIENPFAGNWKEPITSVLAVFKIDNSTRITNNFKAFANTIKTVNNYGVIEKIDNGEDIEDVILNSNDFVKDVVIVLTSTSELRDNISVILNETFESIYYDMMGKEISFEDNRLSAEEVHEITQNNGWANEAELIQNSILQAFEVYDEIKKDSSKEALIDELEKIGISINYARDSKLISKPFKTFITGFIQEKTNFKDSVKNEMIEIINTQWNDDSVDFAKTFKTLEETAKVANTLNNSNSISFAELTPTLESIADDEATKNVIANMIQSGIIEDVAGENSSTNAVKDILENFVTSDSVNGSTIENDVAAGEKLVNTVNKINKTGDMGLGTTTEERNTNADALILDLISSKATMEYLANSCASEEGSPITDSTQSISSADKSTISERILELGLEDLEVSILKATFNIA